MSRNPIRSGETVDETVANRGRIDILVNNAGLQFVSPIDDYPLDKWNQLIAVLLTGPFLFIQAVLPAMRAQKWGRIINICVDQWQARRTGEGGLLLGQARRDRI